MYFALIKKPEEMDYYGNVPEIIGAPESSYERYVFSESERDFLMNDFVNPINELCGTLLDLGDIDFFDCNACEKLMEWLKQRLIKEAKDYNLNMYRVLKDYCEQALCLNTGIVVEL